MVPEEINNSWGQFKSEESIMHIIIWEVKTRVCDRGCLKGDQLQMKNTFAGSGGFQSVCLVRKSHSIIIVCQGKHCPLLCKCSGLFKL